MSPDILRGHSDEQPDDEQNESVTGKPIIEMASTLLLFRYLEPVQHGQPVSVLWPYPHIYGNVVDENHPLGSSSVATDPDHPAVLYDDGAAYCSPILGFDEAGVALHSHDTPVGVAAFGLDGFRDLEEQFLPELKRRATKGKVSLVMGGTNVDATDKGRAMEEYLIDHAINGVHSRFRAAYPDGDFYPLISQQYESQQPTHPLIPPRTIMRGFLFIPQYLARDRKNHVLAIPDDRVRHLRSAFYWTDLPKR